MPRGRPRKQKSPEELPAESEQKVEEENEINLDEIQPDDTVDVEGSQSNRSEEDERSQELWENFKEEHYETVEQLPLYLHRTYRLIRDLDMQTQNHQREIQRLLRAYLECRRKREPVKDETRVEEISETVAPFGDDPTLATPVLDDQQNGDVQGTDEKADKPESRTAFPAVLPSFQESRSIITRLAVLLDEWVQNCDEKVNLTNAAYDSTDRHIRILDSAITEQEKASLTSPTTPRASHSQQNETSDVEPEEEEDADVDVDISGNKARPAKRRAAQQLSKTSTSNSKKRKRPPTTPPLQASPLTVHHAPPPRRKSNAINMAVLPHEPLYCYCNQVSHGSMVACDNGNCPREWFHFECVGITDFPPQGKRWYCADCSEALGHRSDRTRKKR